MYKQMWLHVNSLLLNFLSCFGLFKSATERLFFLSDNIPLDIDSSPRAQRNTFRLLWISGRFRRKMRDARRIDFHVLSIKHGMASLGAEKIGKTPKIVSTVWAFYMKFSSKNIVSAFFSDWHVGLDESFTTH